MSMSMSMLMSYGNNVHTRLGVRFCQPKRPTGKYQRRQPNLSSASDEQLEGEHQASPERHKTRGYEAIPP